MHKAMRVLLLLLCALGCAAWAADPLAEPLPATKVNPTDGAEMILIPAGTFMMGTNVAPQRTVDLDAFYVYKTEVTVAQYRKFCDETKRAMPLEPTWKWQDTHPIVNVTWADAKAYADWAGAALPTEAQWEKAARGGDGRPFPWGFAWNATKCANFSNSGAGKTTVGTHPVGSFPAGASPYGALDMAGNVWEWCADWYGADYYKNAATKNPTGPSTGTGRVLRGGSWFVIYFDGGYFRTAYRGFNYGDPDYWFGYVGFRCASPRQDADSPLSL